MDTEKLQGLFQCINKDTIILIDSLSVLDALSELSTEHVDEQLFSQDILRIILQNKDVERCALLMNNDDQLELAATAWWDDDGIKLQSYDKGMLKSYAAAIQKQVAPVLKSGEIEKMSCQGVPCFMGVTENQELSGEVVGVRIVPGSMMLIPLKNKHETLGVLCLYHSAGDYFTTTHQQFFGLFAKLLVQMIVNIRCVSDLEALVEKRTRHLEKALHEAQKLQRDFRDLSMIDEQTGLPNRRFYCVESQAALARAARYQRDFSCCLLEIHNFKELVKEQGLFAGDMLMEVVADILKLQIREGDILAHYHGEKFVISLPEVDAEGARQFADRIFSVLSDARQGVATLDKLDLRIGLSSLQESDKESTKDMLQSLMNNADTALKQSSGGSNSIVHHQDLFDQEQVLQDIS